MKLFWYIFRGEPKAKDGYIELDDTVAGLGLSIDETALVILKLSNSLPRGKASGLRDSSKSSTAAFVGWLW